MMTSKSLLGGLKTVKSSKCLERALFLTLHAVSSSVFENFFQILVTLNESAIESPRYDLSNARSTVVKATLLLKIW